MAVVVTVAKGYDLDYVWKNQGQPGPERSTGGYYTNAAQAGEPPGRWWGPGAAALGLGQDTVVERKPYNAVYEQIDPVPARSSADLVVATRSTPTIWPA
jgi:hypothetical protein